MRKFDADNAKPIGNKYPLQIDGIFLNARHPTVHVFDIVCPVSSTRLNHAH